MAKTIGLARCLCRGLSPITSEDAASAAVLWKRAAEVPAPLPPALVPARVP